MPKPPKSNRKYKSSVFTSLFSDKKRLLELYNAIEGTKYKDPNLIDINTLEDAIFMDRINDLSFTIDNKLVVLIEHQSTINDNMPLRFLIYISRVYEQIIDNKAIYKQDLIEIPTPEFIVLYNGAAKFPKTKTLKLSKAFKIKNKPIFLDLSVKVININKGQSPELEKRSKSLSGYAELVDKAREFGENKEAIAKAVKYCISHGILLDYLKEHGSEVVNMIFTEWNWDDAKAVWQEEAEARGIRKGEARGIKKGEARGIKKLFTLLEKGLSLTEAKKQLARN